MTSSPTLTGTLAEIVTEIADEGVLNGPREVIAADRVRFIWNDGSYTVLAEDDGVIEIHKLTRNGVLVASTTLSGHLAYVVARIFIALVD